MIYMHLRKESALKSKYLTVLDKLFTDMYQHINAAPLHCGTDMLMNISCKSEVKLNCYSIS